MEGGRCVYCYSFHLYLGSVVMLTNVSSHVSTPESIGKAVRYM